MRFLRGFGFIWFILLYRMFRKRTPLNVMINLTERCNLDCSHCFVGPPKGNEMTGEEVIRIIRELSSMGTRNIVLMGGEIR
jgi:MoaA/NifB/PqqE/SkfB family radical SAM enzyme